MSPLDFNLWRRLEPLLDRLLATEPAARKALLDDETIVAPDLRPHLEKMLAAADGETSPLDDDLSSWGKPLFAGDDESPARVGHFRLLRLLGRGGMGAVHLAERDDGTYRQEVALKILRRGLDTDEILARFRRERQILAGLNHPGIARLIDGGATDDGRPYLVMEHVDGVPLTDYAENQQLTTAACLDLLIQACDAVGYAQRRLVVHRDLKPANILVTSSGVVKLLDFGVAKLLTDDAEMVGDDLRTLTGEGVRLLTPAYAAPEQMAGEPVTTATDVHALGILMHELLAGHPTNGELANIVAMATREEPDLRYASAVELGDDLRRYARGEVILARPATVRYRFEKFARRRRAEIGVAAAIFLLLVAGMAGTTWQAHRAAREAIRAGEITAFLVNLFDASDPDASGGENPTARELLGRGAARIRDRLADDPDTRAQLLNVLGDLHTKLGDYEAARPLLQESLDIRRGQSDRSALRSGIYRLATVDIHLGLYDRADSLMSEAQAMFAVSEGDSEKALFLSDLAVLKSNLGEFEVSQEFFLRSLTLHERLYGPDHLKTAVVLSNYGVLLVENGQIAEGAAKARLVADKRRSQLPNNHSEVAVALHNLAFALAALDSTAEAERHYAESIAIRRRLFPQGHPDLAHTMRQLASLLTDERRFDEAEALLAESATMNARFFSEPHVATAKTWNDLAIVAYRRGAFVRAADGFREALAVFEDLLPDDHGILLQVENNLAGSLRRAGKLANAEQHYLHLYDRRNRRGEKRDPLRARDLLDAGRTFRLRGNLERAAPLLMEAYDRRQADPKASELQRAQAAHEFGMVRDAAGDQNAARRLLEAALPIFEAELAAEDPSLTELRAALARMASGSEARPD